MKTFERQLKELLMKDIEKEFKEYANTTSINKHLFKYKKGETVQISIHNFIVDIFRKKMDYQNAFDFLGINIYASTIKYKDIKILELKGKISQTQLTCKFDMIDDLLLEITKKILHKKVKYIHTSWEEDFLVYKEFQYGVEFHEKKELQEIILNSHFFKQQEYEEFNHNEYTNVINVLFKKYIDEKVIAKDGEALYKHGLKIKTMDLFDYRELKRFTIEMVNKYLNEQLLHGAMLKQVKNKAYDYFGLTDKVKASMQKMKIKKHEIFKSQMQKLINDTIDRFDIDIEFKKDKCSSNYIVKVK